jgi:hypothetical protein
VPRPGGTFRTRWARNGGTMREVAGRLRGAAVAAGLTAALTAGPSVPALAAAPPADPPSAAPFPEPRRVENIPVHDVVLTVGQDSVLHVRETIIYDFDEDGGHGIVRRVPYRRGDRLYSVGDVRAGSSTGAPARARAVRLMDDVRITVGERGRRVAGRQAYVIEYRVAGAFTPHRDRDELVWDAIGTAWKVPIGEAAVRVETPVPLRRASCRAGRFGTDAHTHTRSNAHAYATRCLRDRDGPYAIDFTQRGLRPGEGMLIQVRLPKGVIDVPPPRYARPRWTGTWAGTAALAVALAAVAVAARPGRPGRRPGPGAGELLVTGGTLAVLADIADDVVARGPWAYSLGDLSLTGLALLIAGAAAGYCERLDGGARPTA